MLRHIAGAFGSCLCTGRFIVLLFMELIDFSKKNVYLEHTVYQGSQKISTSSRQLILTFKAGLTLQ